MFPKENATDSVSDNAQRDLPSDGKYEGFADVNDVIVAELKNLLSTEDSKGTTDIVSLDGILRHCVQIDISCIIPNIFYFYSKRLQAS